MSSYIFLRVSLYVSELGEFVPAYVYEVDGRYVHLLFSLGGELVQRMVYVSSGKSEGCGFWLTPVCLESLRAYVREHYTYISIRGRYWWTSGHRLWTCTAGLSVVPSWSFYSPDVGAYLESCGFSIVDLE